MDGESRRRGSVLLKGVREKILEIFEKSIDKHKIDAILIRRPDSSGSLFWGAAEGGRKPEDSEEESGEPSRYKDSDESRWDLRMLVYASGVSVWTL